MNNTRRKAIKEAIDKICGLFGDLEDAKYMLEAVKDEEQDAFDNFPENLQNSERGEAMEQAIDTLDEAICTIDEAFDNLEQLTTDLDDLIGG